MLVAMLRAILIGALLASPVSAAEPAKARLILDPTRYLRQYCRFGPDKERSARLYQIAARVAATPN